MGSRIHSDKYLAARLNAADMITKGCTACYDLYFELPLPTTEGVESAAQAYADTGIRAVVAPMMADKLFFEASSLPATAEIIYRRLLN